MELSERDAPRVARGKLLDRPVNLTANTFDSRTDDELGSRARQGGHHQRCAPNAWVATPAAPVEHQGRRGNHDTGQEHRRQNAADERTSERARRERGKRRRCDNGGE